jgi:F420-0:gamma-glutamyl ligase
MRFIKVKTRPFLPPQDDLFELMDQHLPKLKEGDILFITSKILGMHQGRTVKIQKPNDKFQIIKQEADFSLPKHKVGGHGFMLTIKDHTLIPSAGIDESNGNGYHILWPQNTQKLLREIWKYLSKKHHIKNLGIVATDSHTIPLRWGTQGISIGFYGFKPLVDYRGQKDIFGRLLKYTQSNVVDSLTATAVLLMGEGKEKTPMLIARGLNFVKFTTKDLYKTLVINPKHDIYAPLLKPFRRPARKRHLR